MPSLYSPHKCNINNLLVFNVFLVEAPSLTSNGPELSPTVMVGDDNKNNKHNWQNMGHLAEVAAGLCSGQKVKAKYNVVNFHFLAIGNWFSEMIEGQEI